jgi:hypothetical protein
MRTTDQLSIVAKGRGIASQKRRSTRLLTYSGKARGNHGIATNDLAVDILSINEFLQEQIPALDLTLIPGTFNLELPSIVTLNLEAKYLRETGKETLSFQRCRCLLREGTINIRALWMRSSAHNANADFLKVAEIMSARHIRNSWNIQDDEVATIQIDGGKDWWEAVELLGNGPEQNCESEQDS